jgi:hypothetical protein
MAQKIKTALPPDLDLGGSYVIEWDAVDPTTGASVAGVKVSSTSLLVAGDFGQGADGDVPVGPFMLVPGPAA